MAGKPKSIQVMVQPIEWQTLKIPVVGDSPLLCNNFSTRALDAIQETQEGAHRPKREKRVPLRDYARSLYWMNGAEEEIPCPYKKGWLQTDIRKGKFGANPLWFKEGMVGAARYVEGLTMVMARQVIRVMPYYGLIPMKGKPVMHRARVRNANGVMDLRFRGLFRQWACTVEVEFMPNVLSADAIVNLMEIAGSTQGAGDWRAEKGGTHGLYHVVAKGRSE